MNFFLILIVFLNLNIVLLCPVGTTQGIDQNLCYKFIGAPTDFWSANSICKQNNGVLASVSSAFVNNFLSGTLKSILSDPSTLYWLGGTKNSTNSSWYWVDGNPYTFTSYGKGQPSNGNCIAINPSQNSSNWFSYDCQTQMPYICEIQTISPTIPTCTVQTSSVIPTVNPVSKCIDGYQYFDITNSCYKYVNKSLSFNESENYCKNESGHLVSIHSKEEDEIVNTMYYQNNTEPGVMWIGLKDFTGNYYPQYWSWTDGSPVNYTNWYTPPENDVDPGPCAEYITKGSRYMNGQIYWQHEFSCSYARPFVCKQNPILS